jgi:deazaflavin-dependent oxidoreductase (nitroreductase family)
MAKEYEVSRGVNRFTSWMARRGLGRTHLMTTTGRKSGEPRQVPVSPISHDGVEYLVSPYGAVSWVHNVRANPTVELRLGSTRRTVRLEEVGGAVAAPIVAAYHARERFARPYMDVPEQPAVEDFAAASDSFPVFKVIDES